MTAAMSKVEQYEKTRSALLSGAHELFAEQGYAGTSTRDIVERADVTRGALYYHFQSKEDLFRVVFERLQQARVQEAEGDLWRRFVETGCTAFIESLSDKSTQRIIFTDGPSVLAPDIWRKNVQGVDFLTQVFEQLEAEGFIEEKTPHKALARLVWGAFLEAGIYVSHATDTVGAQHEMLEGLRYLARKTPDQALAGRRARLPAPPLPRISVLSSIVLLWPSELFCKRYGRVAGKSR